MQVIWSIHLLFVTLVTLLKASKPRASTLDSGNARNACIQIVHRETRRNGKRAIPRSAWHRIGSFYIITKPLTGNLKQVYASVLHVRVLGTLLEVSHKDYTIDITASGKRSNNKPYIALNEGLKGMLYANSTVHVCVREEGGSWVCVSYRKADGV